jgi:hypothetical protein
VIESISKKEELTMRMKRFTIVLTVLGLASFAGAIHNDAWAGIKEAVVDCAKEQLIADAIAKADDDEGIQITIKGTCTEIVTVTTDGVTFRGDPGVGGTLMGGFIVDGAQRVVIDDLTVTGSPDNGVLAKGGAAVTVSNSIITDHGRSGIAVILGATAQINGNTISDNDSYAIVVVEEGSARLRSNTVTTDFIPGALGVFRNASLRLNGGNTITNTNGAGNAQAIEVFHVSNLRQDNVGDRGRDVFTAPRVISIGKLSLVDLRAFVATGNAVVRSLSQLSMSRDGTYNGDVTASGPFAVVQKAGTVAGTSTCAPAAFCAGF